MKRILCAILLAAMLITAIPFSVSAADAPIIPETGMPFKDVKTTHWFYDAVKYTYENGIFSANNSAGDKFAPNATMTRGMFVTVLFRLSETDQSAYTGATKFTDVAKSQWYAKAVQWANEKGYVAGMTENTFNPNGKITRSQMARILALYAAGEDNYDLTDVRASAFEKFADTDKVQAWAKEGITWMSTTGLINGMGTKNGGPVLNPNGNATRAQAAQILKGYMELRYKAETPVGDIMIGDTSIKEYTIVYGTTAAVRGTSAESCAKELRSYLAKALGVTLPVYKDTDHPVGEKEILIGKTNRENNVVTVDRSGFDCDTLLMEVQNGYLILASDENYYGTVYAVYEFLERYAGVTFFGAIETFTSKNCYNVPADLHHVESTTMHHRDFLFDNGDLPNVGQKIREGSGYFSQANFYHAMPALGQDPSDFKPEWGYYTNLHMSSDPCLTDPKIQQNIITNVKTQLDKSPHSRFIWVAMSDSTHYCKGGPKCQCDEFYREHGKTSTYFNILDVVADALEEDYGEYYVVGFAYKYTWNMPKNFDRKDINDSVVVCICSDNACATHTRTETNCTDRTHNAVKYASIFAAWREIAPTVWVWDYTSGTQFADAPFPIIHQMYHNYQYFHDMGVSGMLIQGDNINTAPFTELKLYLIPKLVWEADMTEAQYWKYVDSFLEAFYGDGWTYIREYIDKTYELQYENEWHIWANEFWDSIITEEQYRENFDYLMGLWNKAEELASTPEQKLRVRRSATQMEFIKVCLAYETYRASQDQADLDAYNKTAEAYFDYLDTLESSSYHAPSNWDANLDPRLWSND